MASTITASVSPELAARVEAWRQAQTVPPSLSGVVSAALEAWLDSEETTAQPAEAEEVAP